MMKKQLFKSFLGRAFAVILLFVAGCEEKDFKGSRSNDESALTSLRIEIEKLSGQANCNDAADWAFVAMGAKACGGPTNYIAYSKKIDIEMFLKKVALYTEKQKAFNIKWNIMSDCMAINPPKSIECVDGKAKLVY